MSAIQQMILAAYGSAPAVWTPATLFAASEQGVWYDPSDFSTLFQNSAGTTPVTAVEQPVGLILDKSQGLVLGSELVTNGNFSNGTTGWVAGANTTLSIVGGRLRATAIANGAIEATSSVAFRSYPATYNVSGNVTKSTATNVYSLYPSWNLIVLGDFNRKIAATVPTTIGFVTNSTPLAGDYFEIDNISVRELPGNHSNQATAAARPVWATGIDLDGVDDSMAQSAGGGSTTAFMLCAAVKPEGGAASARTIWSDAGTNTGYIVRLNASNQLEMSVGNGTAYTTIATTATVDVGTAYVVTAWDDGTNLNVQVNNGAVASVARPTVSAGTATATLGKNNGAATGFFNGQLISVVQVKNDGGTADERTAAKAYAAGKGGVTL